MKKLPRITLDPAVMGGKACIRGLRAALVEWPQCETYVRQPIHFTVAKKL